MNTQNLTHWFWSELENYFSQTVHQYYPLLDLSIMHALSNYFPTKLDTNDYNEVALECQSVSARWRDLRTRLRVLPHTMNNIQATHRGDVERCLPAVIEKWLQRPVGEVSGCVLPNWRNLCEALSHIDRPLADRIARKRGCGDITDSDTCKYK